MKAIMISIKPKWVAKILNGEKTIEIRKTLPKCELPVDVYIYCTKDKKYANLINRGGFLTGMVVAKFTFNKVDKHHVLPTERILPFNWNVEQKLKQLCLTKKEVMAYGNGEDYQAFLWHIDNLVIFDKPKELSEFYKIGYLEERYAIESHLADIEGCDEGVNESYVDKLYEELDQEFQLKKAPQSWCYVEVEVELK